MLKPADEIKTDVQFATGDGPYKNDYPPATTVATVLADSMRHFEVTSDGTTRYYLLHSGKEPGLAETLLALAGHAHAVHFSLRTETTQG